ncbi:MAG: tetratricopeptide repeat protein [Candidatus Zixiibacteriota bacterium]|nr:MAG: tetratricopeptide repeat protein [candidate division Zixibacteria bacterium]
MLKDSAVIDFFSNEMVLVKVDAEVDTNLAKSFHVSGYPTLVMTDKDGQEIDRIVGYLDPEEFIQTLVDYQNGIGTLDDLLSRADTSLDRELFYEIANKYKYRGGDAEAIGWFQRVIDEGEPTDSMSGESRMSLADMYRRAKEYDRAAQAFTDIMGEFKGTTFAEGAEIWRAIVYRQKGDTSSAVQAFKDFMVHYPESEDSSYARSQIEKLTGTSTKTE